MSDKQELTRAELVRLRREQEHAKHMQRASKVARARPVVVNALPKQDITKPVRKPARKNARRAFQIAFPHAARQRPFDQHSASELRLAVRFLRAGCHAWHGDLLCIQSSRTARDRSAIERQPNAHTSGDELSIEHFGTTDLPLTPSDIGDTPPPQLPRTCLRPSDRCPAQSCLCQRDRAAAGHPLGTGRRLHMDRGGWHRLPSAEAKWLD